MSRAVSAALLLALLGAAACGGERHEDPAEPSASPTDWGWPAVPDADGRSQFQLQAILRTGPYEAGGGPTLQVQGRVESDEAELHVSDVFGKLRVVADDGKERVWDRERSNVDAAHRNVTFFGIDAGPDPKRLRSLELELRLVRVQTWATREVEIANPEETRRIALPPFEFAVMAEETGVVVTAYSTDETLDGHERAWNRLSHRWAAAAGEVVDARGDRLGSTAGTGSGGATSQTYSSVIGAGSAIEVAYPVTVTLRVPTTWEDEVVRYRFTDLDLAKVPPAR